MERDEPLLLKSEREDSEPEMCSRCGRVLEYFETGICTACAGEVWRQKRRRNLFIHFFFQLSMLIFVYLYFYKGILVIYRYFRG
ncbi:MAG: hypothetical protein GXO65_06840 [Euryarchaeota archaeon]|nr:hypothetical protein [Euryarchaeota archaeon]